MTDGATPGDPGRALGYVPFAVAALAAATVTALAPRGSSTPVAPEPGPAASTAPAATSGVRLPTPPHASAPGTTLAPPPTPPVLQPPALAQLTKKSRLTWQLFAGTGFRVALPTKPKDFTFKSKTLLGELTQRGLESKLGSIATFSASVTEYPRGPRSVQERSTFYLHARHQTRSRVKGNETSSRQTQAVGQPAERFGGAIGNVRSYEAIVVCLERQMYQLLIQWKSGALDLAERDTFFRSLAIGKSPPNVASADPPP